MHSLEKAAHDHADVVKRLLITDAGHDDAKQIADPEWRKQLADSICVGVEGYRALVEKKQRPMLVAEYRAQAEPAVDSGRRQGVVA